MLNKGTLNVGGTILQDRPADDRIDGRPHQPCTVQYLSHTISRNREHCEQTYQHLEVYKSWSSCYIDLRNDTVPITA